MKRKLRRLSCPERVWASISPPRIRTATMLAAYALAAYMGFVDVLLRSHVPPLVLAGGWVVILGAVCAIPAAWRGRWAVEAPAAGLIALGMGMEVADEILVAPSPHLPIHACLTVILLLSRVEAIWGRTWDPARDPVAKYDDSITPLAASRALERKAVEGALLREARGWIAD